MGVPSVTLCIVSNVTSGEFVLGSKTVPINKPVTLQGGLIDSTGMNSDYLLRGSLAVSIPAAVSSD